MSILWNFSCTSPLYWRCILHLDSRNSTKGKSSGNFQFCFFFFQFSISWNEFVFLNIWFFYICEQHVSDDTGADKVDSNRRSRWWRLRSILALVFRRRRRNNWIQLWLWTKPKIQLHTQTYRQRKHCWIQFEKYL